PPHPPRGPLRRGRALGLVSLSHCLALSLWRDDVVNSPARPWPAAGQLPPRKARTPPAATPSAPSRPSCPWPPPRGPRRARAPPGGPPAATPRGRPGRSPSGQQPPPPPSRIPRRRQVEAGFSPPEPLTEVAEFLLSVRPRGEPGNGPRPLSRRLTHQGSAVPG